MRPVYYAEAEKLPTGAVVAILDLRTQWRQQSGTALSGTRSRPLPATAVIGLRDNAVITFCDTAVISARAGVLSVEKIRTFRECVIQCRVVGNTTAGILFWNKERDENSPLTFIINHC